jgi:hypothetical protein
MDNYAKRRDPAFGHASAEEASLYKIIMSDLSSFERGLLAAMLYDHRVAVIAEPLVLKDQHGAPIEDFVVPMHQALYTAIQRYHITTNHAFYAAPSLEGIRLELLRVANERDCMLTEDQIPYALQALSEACYQYQSAPQYMSDMTRKGLACWLQERRLQEYQKRRTSLWWSSVQFSQEWASEQVHLKNMAGSDEEKLWYSIDDCLVWEPVNVFLNFPWQGVNERMGGGLARGDATLIVGSTGAGKTVVASQVTGHFVIRCGAKGVFISTEQKGPGVLPRLVSCFSGVDFSLLNKHRTIQLDTLQPGPRRSVEDTLLTLQRHHFHFRDWKPGDSIVSGIKSIVDHYCERLSPDGTIDFIVMDWIGGSIEHGAKDKDESRMRMQHAADTIALLADELQIVTIATAQANPQQSAKVAQVGGQHISECKTMHRHFENLIGISGLQDVSVGDDDSISARYLHEQYLYIDKSRFGPGGSVPVSRLFATQRLEQRFGRQ